MIGIARVGGSVCGGGSGSKCGRLQREVGGKVEMDTTCIGSVFHRVAVALQPMLAWGQQY